MKQTLTTEQLKHILDNPNEFSLSQVQEMAAELLANREAQPVGYFVRHRSAWGRPSKWRLWTECSAEDYAEFCKIIATGEDDAGRFYEARILYDAPPSPASAFAVAWEMRYWNSGHGCWHDWERISAEQHAEMSAEHATDNDYEFRVMYDAPPAPAVPDDWRLVPVEPTEEMLRAAYRESGVYSAKAYRAMLAAAPEGENG